MQINSYSILITGASGAIGRALAVSYAEPGIRLVLHGRDAEKLAQTVRLCEQQGALVYTSVLDLSCVDEIAPWAQQILSKGEINLFIANAGMCIGHGEDGSLEYWQAASKLIDLNLKANMALVNAFLPAMRSRREGQIVFISSLAAYFGLPNMPAYSASKAGLKAYGESLRAWLAPEGIRVNVVMPGYVASEMGESMPGSKPFQWTAEQAAQAIKKGITKNQARISFPFPLNMGAWFLAVLPTAISIQILKWLK